MANANTLTITQDTFDRDVLQADKPVLVDFYADWCAPCRALGPTIDELANDYQGQAGVGKVNVDQAQNLAAEYEITSIPAVLLFVGGQVVARFNGIQPKADLARAIDTHLATAAS